MSAARGYYRHPTIHAKRVVFVSEDDLWSVSAEGGVAHRLTAGAGTVSFPRLAPDGSLIAYTSRDEGPPEAWVMEVEGGPPRRLTWMGSSTHVAGWDPDGSAVIVATDWKQPFRNFFHLHRVPLEGGTAEPLEVGPSRAVSFRPDGKGMVIGRGGLTYLDPARWKRYRGGTAGTLWVDPRGKGRFSELIRLPGNLADPMWIDSRIFFLSDHEGTANLYSVKSDGDDLRRHTHHEGFYARYPATDGQAIVYHRGADLYVFDPESEEARELEVTIPSARPQRRRKFIAPGKYLESFDLHPEGHSVAAVARGGVYTMPLWEGAPEQHGEVSGARQRLAAWLPDGERVVAVTDQPGEEGLAVLAPGQEATVIEADLGRPDELVAAPAGPDRVALSNHRHEVIVVDLGTGKARTVHRSAHHRIGGLSWSPDGRWLAFAAHVSRNASAIHLHDTRKDEVHQITGNDFRDLRPAFDPAGRYLYFVSYRVFDPVPDGHAFDYGFPKGSRPHLITLRADLPSPFSSASRPPRAPGAPVENEDENEEGEDRSAPVEIDLEGIGERVVALPVPEGRYGRVLGAADRIMFSSYPVEGGLADHWSDEDRKAKGKLEAYDFGREKVETVLEGISDFTVSADGKVMGARVENRLRVLPAGFRAEEDKGKESDPGRETGWVDLKRIRVEVHPSAEWQQMYREAWRLQRDHFWTPDMSGVDWQAVHDRYLPLVERVGCRSEFSDLLWEMQGELGTSHAYELGGDYRPQPKWFQGFLGADLELDGRDAWRVARIPRGDPWKEKQASPLAAPGIGVAQGDRIVAVDGRPVGRDRSPYECLVDRAGREVHLTVRSGRRGPRTVTVKTLRHEYDLRYRDWVEANRERVHRETDGRVGYVHIPNMGPLGYAEFHRSFLTEVDRDGLIVDVRHNGGGNVSQLLLQKLLRRRIGYDVNRWGEPFSYPMDAPRGPMVALTDEYAGSDGDIFSHAFKLYGLGPLIGKRTWGGVVGIWPRHSLVDGTITTQPEFAFWFEDVGWGVENYGTEPDIEVDITPDDHRAGRDPQLERAIAEVTALVEQLPPEPSFEERPDRRPPRLPET